MKEFSFNPNLAEYQLAKKYIKGVDQHLTSVINFMDFYNANYIIINKEYTAGGKHFLPNSWFLNDGDINYESLLPHQIVINNFKPSGCDIRCHDEKVDTLQEGYALICCGYKADGITPHYLIVSLDASGAYYVLTYSSLTQTTWNHTDNAIDQYGTTYNFTLVPVGIRYYYHGTNNTSWKTWNAGENIIYNITLDDNDDVTAHITTCLQTYWTADHILSHEIYGVAKNSAAVEEIYCTEEQVVGQTIVRGNNVSYHRLKTNLQNCTNWDFYINYF